MIIIEILGWIFLGLIVVVAVLWSTGKLEFMTVEEIEEDCHDSDKQ